MNVLVLANNDSDNLMIVNVLFELQNRGHQLKIFAHKTDEKSIRMFYGLDSSVQSSNKINTSVIQWADCILSALRANVDLEAFGANVFCEKYIFMYNQYIENHWFTPGADFMFSIGTSRHPEHKEDCPQMAIGCTKNDRVSTVERNENVKKILYIDSGHYPFSHKGKIQVADMLIKICQNCPDYELVVKPRFLPTDINMLHTNTDHIYTLIQERSEGVIPENLTLLQEHLDMQDLLDDCSCVVMLCTSAYLDVALRGKNMVIVKGVDNEDKYELRNEIEYKNIYELREKSGCVVDYHEVINYLPFGISCKEEHLKELIAYPTDASARMAEVMEYINENFLSKGMFPAIKEYHYETYQDDMKIDETLSWKVIKQKRIKNIGNNRSNFLNYVTAKISRESFYYAIDQDYTKYPTTVEGAKNFVHYLENIIKKLWVSHQELMMDDPMNQAELFRALYELRDFQELRSIKEEQILCWEPYHFYLGIILYNEKRYDECIPHFLFYLKEANQRTFEKYVCEQWWGLRDAYSRIAKIYNENNISSEDFAMVIDGLYKKQIHTKLSSAELEKLHRGIPKACEILNEQGEYELAAKCAVRHFEYQKKFNKQKKADAEIKKLRKKIETIYHSKPYRLGKNLLWLPDKLKNGLQCMKDHGIFYTISYTSKRVKNVIIAKKRNLKQKLLTYTPFRILYEFKSNILLGYKNYRKLINQYGEDTYIYMGARSTGDVYISGLYYKEYLKKKKMEKQAIYVLPAENCCKVLTMLFGIERVEKVDLNNVWNRLLKFYQFSKKDSLQLDLLFYRNGCTISLEGYKEWNLYSLLYTICFSELDINNIKKPVFCNEKEKILTYFTENGLIPQKTVILLPYARWAAKLPVYFWEQLVIELKKQGYIVCTNSTGSQEPAIKGSVSVFFNYIEAVTFVEQAGYVIGLRSGLLDIIESANCKKIALYPYNCPKRGIANSTALGSFSLNAMFHREDWLELETTPNNLNFIIRNILAYLSNKLTEGTEDYENSSNYAN